ncbi:MAG TPA: periplasmic heavy metal sensor [Polyangiaceae bacterium]|jgi:hypothetical protein
MWWHRVFGSLSVAIVLAAAAPAHAENAAQKRAEIAAHLRGALAQALRKDVGLDEKKATDVERTLDKFRPQRERLEGDMHQQQKTLRALLDLDSNDQGAYQKALNAERDDTQKLAAVREQEIDELSKQLTPKQQAKLARAVKQLEQRLKNAMRKFREENGAGDD